jgi:WD40 repeat protein
MLYFRPLQGKLIQRALAVFVGLTGSVDLPQARSADDPAKNGKWEERHAEVKGAMADVWLLALSPDGKTVAVANFSNQGDMIPVPRIWDISGKELREQHKLAGHHKTTLAALAFGAEGKTLLSVGADGMVKVWDVGSGKAQGAFAVGKKGEFNTVAGAWVTAEGNSLMIFPPPRRAGAFSDTRPVPPRVEIWDPHTGKQKGAVPLPPGQHGMALSADGKTMLCATGPVDDLPGESVSQMRFWNLQNGKQLGLVKSPGVTRALFSPTGKTVIFQRMKNDGPSLALWDLATNKGSIPSIPALKSSHAHGFSGDGKLLVTASADKRTITIWDMATEKPVASLPPLDSTVATAALSPDGHTVVAITDLDNILHVWTYKDR